MQPEHQLTGQCFPQVGYRMYLHVLSVHFFNGEQNIFEAFARGILQCLPAAVVIHPCPGSYRPAVVHLPVQCAHAVRLVSPVAFNRDSHRLRLKKLAHIQD
ncbi:hypothetical protein D3C74_439760 [compost metagenome]